MQRLSPGAWQGTSLLVGCWLQTEHPHQESPLSRFERYRTVFYRQTPPIMARAEAWDVCHGCWHSGRWGQIRPGKCLVYIIV